MASKDFKNMINMGKWLEKLLNPKTKVRIFENIFNEGAHILNINSKFNSNLEPLFQNNQTFKDYYIQCKKDFNKWKIDMEPLKEEWDNFKKHKDRFSDNAFSKLGYWNEGRENGLIEQIFSKEQWDNFKKKEFEIPNDKILSKLGDWKECRKSGLIDRWFSREKRDLILKKAKEMEDYEIGHKIYLKLDFIKFYDTLLHFNSLLNTVKKSASPWVKTLNLKEQKSNYLINNYNNIVENLQMSDGELIVKKIYKTNVDKTFAIFSNILIDFLMLGGQDYFIFCNYCNRFTVVERKGRKKFCSDICRTNHRNIELAKK